VELDAEEQAWHARYITAQYSPMNKKKRQASKDGRHREDSADDAASSENGQDTRADASEGTAAATAEDASRRIARVPSRVRCSLSDQYPLLTLLK
jgi:type IV secretory pathway TrbL component